MVSGSWRSRIHTVRAVCELLRRPALDHFQLDALHSIHISASGMSEEAEVSREWRMSASSDAECGYVRGVGWVCCWQYCFSEPLVTISVVKQISS